MICEPIRDTVMFHTAGIVVLTVCINSITMPKLISFLDMDKVAPSKQLIYNQAMRNLLRAGMKQESNLRADHTFDSANWDEARKFYQEVPGVVNATVNRETDVFCASKILDEKETRRRALMITKRSYWRQVSVDGVILCDGLVIQFHSGTHISDGLT